MSYNTVQDIRKEGVTTGQASDSKVSAAIVRWQQFIDRATRQFFEPVAATVDVDGNDSDTLFLPVPIITLTSLFVNNDFVNALPATTYRVYNARGPITDDRRNPKLKLIRTGSIFDPPFNGQRGPVFIFGHQNQRLVGTFGFTEPDGSVPALIKRAHAKMCVLDLTAGKDLSAVLSSAPGPGGAIKAERTDGHEIQYGEDETFSSMRTGLSVITQDEEVTKILELYKGPIGLGVPNSLNWFKG